MDLTSSNQAVMAEALKEGKAASNGIALFETVKSSYHCSQLTFDLV
jgi:hypothetical protein